MNSGFIYHKKTKILSFVILLFISIGLGACGGESKQLSQIMAMQAEQATEISRQWEVISYLATRMPPGNPAKIVTPTPWLRDMTPTPWIGEVTFTPTPYTQDPIWIPSAEDNTVFPPGPIIGSVLIEQGACCKGGIAGSELTVSVDFYANSTIGAITSMRVLVGGSNVTDQGALEKGFWEPFSAQKEFSIILPINWIGFYVSTQYKDEQGNVSPMYWDDISLEGMPPLTP